MCAPFFCFNVLELNCVRSLRTYPHVQKYRMYVELLPEMKAHCQKLFSRLARFDIKFVFYALSY